MLTRLSLDTGSGEATKERVMRWAKTGIMGGGQISLIFLLCNLF